MVPSSKAPNLAFQVAGISRGKTVVHALLTVWLACVRQGEGKPGRLPQRWRAVLTDMCNAAAAARNKE
jgi:hypothetical protein